MATFTNETRNSVSLTNESRTEAVFTNETLSLIGDTFASAGQTIGLLLTLTYSGGQTLVAGTTSQFTNETIN